MTRNFERHLELLFGCRACPQVQGEPVTGPVERAQVMLVGQAPGPREVVEKRPFAFTAGRTLFKWMESIGVDEEDFRKRVYISAVIRCFPGKGKSGGDRVPAPDEIARCAGHLDREIRLLKPQVVIAVGTLAAAQFVPPSPLDQLVGRTHRVTRAGRMFDLIVLPHPSGRSTWTNRPANAKLLARSLKLLECHEAFRRSVLTDPTSPMAG